MPRYSVTFAGIIYHTTAEDPKAAKVKAAKSLSKSLGLSVSSSAIYVHKALPEQKVNAGGGPMMFSKRYRDD